MGAVSPEEASQAVSPREFVLSDRGGRLCVQLAPRARRRGHGVRKLDLMKLGQ